MTLPLNQAPPVPVRNGAPRLDARGRALSVTPWLDRLGDQGVPLNTAEHARLLWRVAQAQAADVPLLGGQLTAQFAAVDAALREQEVQLTAQRDRLQAVWQTELPLSDVDAADVRQRQEAVTRADTGVQRAQEQLAAALAHAGLCGREAFDLHPDQVAYLGADQGTFPQVPKARVWAGAALLASLLMGPALYELGLRAMWLGLGLPESLDPAGVGVACVIGVAVAATLKAVMEQLAFHAAARSAARQVRLAGQPERLDAFLRRHQWWGGLALAVTFGIFAYIEGTLVSSSFAAGDVNARVSGGESPWLQVLSGLIALLPSSLLGIVTGQFQARVLAARSVSARARQEARQALLARPDVRAALAAAHQLDAAQDALRRAEARLETCRAEVEARRTQARARLDAQLADVQTRLTDVRQRRSVAEADFGRRLEELHQRADQSAELALQAYAKASRGRSWASRLFRTVLR